MGPDGSVYAVVAGRPNDPTYMEDQDEVVKAMRAAGGHLVFRPNQLVHKRGKFPAVNVGVTHARGTTEPVNLKMDDSKIIDGLLALSELQWMVKFANGGVFFLCRGTLLIAVLFICSNVRYMGAKRLWVLQGSHGRAVR